MAKVIPVEYFDKDGNLTTISFSNEETGKHVVDAMWDPRDEQTSENRAKFRQWAYRIVEQQGHEVLE